MFWSRGVSRKKGRKKTIHNSFRQNRKELTTYGMSDNYPAAEVAKVNCIWDILCKLAPRVAKYQLKSMRLFFDKLPR